MEVGSASIALLVSLMRSMEGGTCRAVLHFTALAVSFIVLVASEFVATKSGIGYLIWNSWELLQVDVMFVGIVTIGVLGLITSVLFQEIERKAVPWKE